jgi:hemoglobin/transferrin/lactoferrin receptor protein
MSLKNKTMRVLLTLTGLAACLTIAAQDAAVVDTMPAFQLQEVIVTTQRAEVYLKDTPASIERLTSKTIALQQSRTTPEALMATAGVFVQKTNHGGGSPFLRGLTGNQTLLLVDGIRLSNATFRYGPNQYLNTIDPFSIQRIEVWKGGGSVTYGSDALGGTINVLTQDIDELTPDGKPHLKMLTQWRSGDMEKTGHLQGGISGRKLAFLAGGSLRRFGDLVGGRHTGVQSPSGYDEYAFDLKGKWRLADEVKLTVAHQTFQQSDVPVYHKVQLEDFALNQFALQKRQLSYARLAWQPNTNLLQQVTATVSLHQTEEQRESRKNGSATLRKEADKVNSLGASVQAVATPTRFWRTTTGLELYADRVGSTRHDLDTQSGTSLAKRGLYPDDATFTSFALFCLNQWEAGQWDFSGGLRYNNFVINLTDETLGKVELAPSAIVFNASLLRRLNNKDNLFIDFNTGFRAPNIDDLGSLGIVDFRYEIPTADLKPEKSYNYELGWRHTGDKVQAAAFVFRNELRDLITRVRVGSDSIAGYPVYRKENVEKGYIQGIEGNIKILFAKHWQIQAALSWQYGQNLTQNEPLRRIPPLFGHFGATYQRDQWRLTLESLFAAAQKRLAAGDKSDNRINPNGTPGWIALNAYGDYTWQWLTVRAGLYNMLNADYRYHGSGVNAAGRHVAASLVFSW